MAYGWPCDPNTTVTQLFGTNINSVQPDGHTGMDFGLTEGSPVYAIGDGTVLVADWSDTLPIANVYGLATTAWLGRSAGIVVVIDHGDIVSISAHLSSTPLNTGDRVTRGQEVGKSGSTGYSFGAHLHFEILPDGWDWRTQRWYGRVDPLKYISKAPVAPPVPSLTSLQRVTGASGANLRPAPNTQGDPLQTFAPGDVLNFVGFVHGEVPPGGNSDIWLKGVSGNYVHVSAVEPANEKGLPDLTPVAPPAPSLSSTQRLAVDGANYRPEPNTSKAPLQSFAAGDVLNFVGFVRGEKVGSSNIWLKGIGGGFVHLSAVQGSSVGSLPDLTPAPVAPSQPVTPTPAPPVVSKPVEAPVEAPTATPMFKAELACVTSVVPAHPDNYQVGNFPEKPTYIVIHQFGSKGVHLNSVINYFAMSLADRRKANPKAGQTSAHFAVENNEIIQTVSLKNRAYHALTAGNDYVGLESGPDQSPATIASVRKAMREINDYFGYPLIPILHKDIPGNSTQCGNDIDLANYQGVGLTPKPTDKTVKQQLTELLAQLTTLIGKL